MDIEALIIESNAIESVYDDSEIAQSLEAWKYLRGVDHLGKKEVLETHRLILLNLRPDIAGKFRKCGVMVGDDVKIPWIKVHAHIIKLLHFQPDDALNALIWHVQFEQIHPFEDGNGRTGRMIYWWHCQRMGLEPILFRAADRWGYYALFQKAKEPR